MAQTNGPKPRIRDVGLTNWLNAKLRPYIGPPPIGPFDEPELAPTQEAACPICGFAMSAHTVDRSGERTQLYCPTPESMAAREQAD